MKSLNENQNRRFTGSAHWGWLLPILALAPFSLAAKGCSNSGVVGNDCPTATDCPTGMAGSSSQAGSGNMPGNTCGGIIGAQCAKGEFCSFPAAAKCGAGDMTGTCQAKPEACTADYDPVCGCDGMTYGNACAAAQAGISVASEGECKKDPTGDTCGGKTGATCSATQYCLYAPDADCGRFDATGTCVDWPKGGACDAVYDPVCGCDGKTYGNDCEASVAGMSVDYTGECAKDPTGTVCGGFTGAQCPAKQYCNYPADMACGNADGQGVCTAIPDTCPGDVDPVCGCDGTPYTNSCEAAAHGVAVLNKGACPK